MSAGETSEQAALREVQEETGLDAEIIGRLDTIEYFFRAGDTLIRKSVDFYLMNYALLCGFLRFVFRTQRVTWDRATR